jgi:hypothetical protein
MGVPPPLEPMNNWYLRKLTLFLAQSIYDILKNVSFGRPGSYKPINGLLHVTANGDIPVYQNCGCRFVIPRHQECLVAIIATQPMWEGKFACLPLKYNSEPVDFFHKVCSKSVPSDLSDDEILHCLGIDTSPIQVDNLNKAFKNEHHSKAITTALSFFDINHTKFKPIHYYENTSYYLFLPLAECNPKFQTDHPELYENMTQAHKEGRKLGYGIDVGGFAAFKEGLFLFCLLFYCLNNLMLSQAELFCSFQVDKASSLMNDSPEEVETLILNKESPKSELLFS